MATNELSAAQAVPQPQQAPSLPEPLNAVAQGLQPATILAPVQPNTPTDPAQDFVVENYDALPDLGLSVFEAPDLTTVVYNPSLLDEPTIKKAVADGTLQQLLTPPPAPTAEPLANASISQARAAQRPGMNVQSAPAAPALPGPKVPASTQNLLARARVRNLGAGPQTPGIKPSPVGQELAKRPV